VAVLQPEVSQPSCAVRLQPHTDAAQSPALLKQAQALLAQRQAQQQQAPSSQDAPKALASTSAKDCSGTLAVSDQQWQTAAVGAMERCTPPGSAMRRLTHSVGT
jgi:hypothetical protein